jgi:hypothetical protein
VVVPLLQLTLQEKEVVTVASRCVLVASADVVVAIALAVAVANRGGPITETTRTSNARPTPPTCPATTPTATRSVKSA